MKRIFKHITRGWNNFSDFTNKHIGIIYLLFALSLLLSTFSNCMGRTYNAGYKAGAKNQLETLLNCK